MNLAKCKNDKNPIFNKSLGVYKFNLFNELEIWFKWKDYIDGYPANKIICEKEKINEWLKNNS